MTNHVPGFTHLASVRVTGAARPSGAGEFLLGTSEVDSGLIRVLVRGSGPMGALLQVDHSSVIPIPPELSTRAALLVPVIAEALRVCDEVGLEIGTTLLVGADDAGWSSVLAIIAACYGAESIVIGTGTDHRLDPADPAILTQVRNHLVEAAAVAAIDVSGRTEVIDLLLETAPANARVLLTAEAPEPLTIDFYTNVHRKGLRLSSTVLSSVRAFDEPAGAAYWRRASAILLGTDVRGQLEAAVSSWMTSEG